MENTENNLVGTGTTLATTASLNNSWTGDYYPGTYTPLVQTYYPNYTWGWSTPSKIEQSFKIVQKLLEKKVIKEPKTIKDFIKLVNVISEVV